MIHKILEINKWSRFHNITLPITRTLDYQVIENFDLKFNLFG